MHSAPSMPDACSFFFWHKASHTQEFQASCLVQFSCNQSFNSSVRRFLGCFMWPVISHKSKVKSNKGVKLHCYPSTFLWKHQTFFFFCTVSPKSQKHLRVSETLKSLRLYKNTSGPDWWWGADNWWVKPLQWLLAFWSYIAIFSKKIIVFIYMHTTIHFQSYSYLKYVTIKLPLHTSQ